MGKKLYVGNLGYDVNDADLSQLFGQHGTVGSANVIMDRATGRSKGFGFVEMSTDAEAQAAIAALNASVSLTLESKSILAMGYHSRGGTPAKCGIVTSSERRSSTIVPDYQEGHVQQPRGRRGDHPTC